MESFVFEQQVLFRVGSLFDLQPHHAHGLVSPVDGERCHNLEHLRLFFSFAFNFLEWNRSI